MNIKEIYSMPYHLAAKVQQQHTEIANNKKTIVFNEIINTIP